MEAIKLSKGAYFDDEEMLHDVDGTLLPDGVYDIEGVGVVSYEGNFANMVNDALSRAE
jgi:hypothetical protein|nr:MAG TPA: hypothetical protein [Caudoviricetes sp.]